MKNDKIKKRLCKGVVTVKKSKNKILAVVITIALIVSVFVVGSVANTKNTSITISIDKTELSSGETATVTVTASADYPVALASIPVFYDKTLVSVSDATATLASDYSTAEVTTEANAVDSSKIYANTSIDSDKFGFVLAVYIGAANEEVPATLENATVLTFTITALSDVSGEAVVKCVTESAKTDDNIEGMLYFGTTISGTEITSIPENVENIDVSGAAASVQVVSGGTQLVAISGKTGVIDDENKYVYGITPGDSVEDYFKVNNGTLELVANESGYTNGTGATINVKDSSGIVIDTYTVIVFGDVNGDSEITGVDLMSLSQYVGGTTSVLTGILLVSADVNADGLTTGVDLMSIAQYTSGTTTAISVNPYA